MPALERFGEEVRQSPEEAASVLLNERLRKLYFTYRSRTPKVVKAASRPIGRPPLSPQVKECRKLYQAFLASYLHQRERLPPEVFDRIHGRFYSFLESHAEDYAALLWFQKEHPWTLQPQALETLTLPETTAAPSDTNKEQLETKEVTTR
jgi:hypothetical protein